MFPCNCNYLLFLSVKTDRHLLLLWLCNYYSQYHCIKIGQQKNYRILYHQNNHLIKDKKTNKQTKKTCNHFQIPDAFQNYFGIFWKIKLCLMRSFKRGFKTTRLYEDFLLFSSLFLFFLFHIQCSRFI